MDFSFSGLGLVGTTTTSQLPVLPLPVVVLLLVRHVFFSVGDELLYKY